MAKTSRHNFTIKQQRAMAERSKGICEAGRGETHAMYGMKPGETCSHKAKEFDHVVADGLKGDKPKSIDEGIHVCLPHHKYKTHKHDRPRIAKAKRTKERALGIKKQTRPIPAPSKTEKKPYYGGLKPASYYDNIKAKGGMRPNGR